jgi:hypothetical protein
MWLVSTGNPCCEEADYRFTLIDAIGSLAILDCHAVTPSERKQVDLLKCTMETADQKLQGSMHHPVTIW